MVTPLMLNGPWHPPDTRPQVGIGDLHVWRMRLRGPRERQDRWFAMLQPDETQRAERFAFDADRVAFAAARTQMRAVLAAYLGQDPGRLRFSYGSYGKPALDGSFGAEPLTFNLSHSGDFALLAVSRLHAVGVDIERLRSDVEYLAVDDQLFCQKERRYLAQLKGDDHTRAFFQLWTHKESVLKALGTGFSLSASACRVDTRRNLVLVNSTAVPPSRRSWRVYSVEPAEGYAGAVTIAFDQPRISLWEDSEIEARCWP